MEIRQAISLYLTAKAYSDTEFKTKYENPAKNLDECVTYITYKMYMKVKEQADRHSVGVAIPSDDEVFALAEQYYMDEDLKVDGTELQNVRVFSASATSFTDEEKVKMRQDAIRKYQDEVIAEQRKKDQERKSKAKEKKPANPVLVPDTEENGVTEEKPKVVQMDLFA